MTITVEKQGALWRITLQRPDKANALSRAMLGAIAEAYEAAAEDGEVRAIVVTGAGPRVFSGGADLSELTLETAGDGAWQRMSRAIAAAPCLTVARINGACLGGALTIALACDLRIAADHAVFGYPVLRNGVMPTKGDIGRLVALAGRGSAKAILLGGARLTAAEALRAGLVEKVVAGDDLDAAVEALIATALAADRGHLARLKRLADE
ncbi:MAG: enoyl-CoA hydratase/isomerase family protein [Hyphomicrobiaceae bacterium]